MRVIIFCLPNTTHGYIISNLDYNIMERIDHKIAKFIYNLLHTNNSTVQSIVNSGLLLYPKSVLSENYTYLMFQYKRSQLYWNIKSHTHIENIKVAPLSEYESCDVYATLCVNCVNFKITCINAIFI